VDPSCDPGHQSVVLNAIDASLLPGLLAATRTGLTPAGDDELVLESVTQ
jgi:hypothetical protein